MDSEAELIYENHLKDAYFPADVGSALAITDTSCFQLSEETAWLIARLPYNGSRKTLTAVLSDLGIKDTAKIFDKLAAIGVLREKRKRSWREAIGTVIIPKFALVSAQLQESILARCNLMQTLNMRAIVVLIFGAFVGYLSWIVLLLATDGTGTGFNSVILAKDIQVFALVVIGSLMHEFGHSWAAKISGIGLRPIGFSVYLMFPVLYTNVSGIEKVGFFRKILIDCGGFICQGIFLLLLLPFAYISGDNVFWTAAWWVLVISLFNLNPFFRTDGYWLYRDMYSEFKLFPLAKIAHFFYLAAFFLFSAYFFWVIIVRAESILRGIVNVVNNPGYFWHSGYRLVLGTYFVFLGLVGGIRRFKEGRQEWKEFAGV